MSKERKQFSRDFKIKVVLAYESGVPAVELSRQFEVHPNVIYNWAREYRKDPDNAFTSSTQQGDPADADQRRIAFEKIWICLGEKRIDVYMDKLVWIPFI